VAIQAQYPEQLSVLLINRNEQTQVANAFLSSIDTTGLTVVQDTEDAFFQAITGQTMPETLIYDGEGTLLYRKQGVFHPGELEQYVQAAVRANL
jgi:hypothetical protein